MLSRAFMKGRKWMNEYRKHSFCVIGKEGSTAQGNGFIQKLWKDANENFAEVEALAVKDENGSAAGVWGAMTDEARRFMPWEDNFSRGLYLAGVECEWDAQAPEGWQKWQIPGFEYLQVENNGETVFSDTLAYMQQNNMPLVGAVQELTVPAEGKHYLLFPIRRLD